MKIEISEDLLLSNLNRQLSAFFRLTDDEVQLVQNILPLVLDRCKKCFSKTENKYYSRNGEVYFNPYHSGQYCIFLFYLSNSVFKESGNSALADKIYYLNKIMNACDLFYEIELPEVFKLDHPVGSVLGRATYGDHFSFVQNCTVGNNRGIFPVIEKNVTMSANSMILGNCLIGENSIIGAGAYVKDEDIPRDSIVFGQSPKLIIKRRK